MAAFRVGRDAGCLLQMFLRTGSRRVGTVAVCKHSKMAAVLAVPQRSLFSLGGKKDKDAEETKALPSGTRIAPEAELPSEQFDFREKFIPITRKSILRHLMQEKDFLADHELKKFEAFSLALDTAIVNRYYNLLQELKALFDPLNPDKETMSTRQWNRRERLDNEFWLLQKLGGIMEKANFHEVSKASLDIALAQHSTPEGVLVSVNTDKYDVMKFWALGRELNLVKAPLWKRIVNMALRRPSPGAQEYFKRVVAAVRLKKDDKLLLKAFKEVPVKSLQMLLPDGKISMANLDKRILMVTLGLGGASLAMKGLTLAMGVNAPWLFGLAGISGAVSLWQWTVYKNRRSLYLVDVTRLLYFKNIANNRGLLTLLVDRAEDESFKEALLTYTFLLTNRQAPMVSQNQNETLPVVLGSMTTGQLENVVEDWVFHKTGKRIEFDAGEAVKLLSDFGLLSENNDELTVLPLEAASRLLPQTTSSLIARSEEYDIVEGYDRDITDEEESEYKAEAKKRRKFGWF